RLIGFMRTSMLELAAATIVAIIADGENSTSVCGVFCSTFFALQWPKSLVTRRVAIGYSRR
ncbi:MAG TPA: hypothetical protein VF306_12875, partial [Pirellulales bacterium]